MEQQRVSRPAALEGEAQATALSAARGECYMRCLYMNQSGWQCPAEALEESNFCADHCSPPDLLEDAETARSLGIITYIRRLIALLLLLIFLFNAYQAFLQWLGR
jgi:hypothetical protein